MLIELEESYTHPCLHTNKGLKKKERVSDFAKQIQLGLTLVFFFHIMPRTNKLNKIRVPIVFI